MMDLTRAKPLLFVKHMLNKESEDEYDDGPIIIFVLAVIVEHVVDKTEVHLKS